MTNDGMTDLGGLLWTAVGSDSATPLGGPANRSSFLGKTRVAIPTLPMDRAVFVLPESGVALSPPAAVHKKGGYRKLSPAF